MPEEKSKAVYLKCKNMMYTQQIQYLKCTLQELTELVKELDPTKYAMIVHDKDVDENGKQVEPHVHLMMCFENSRHVNAIAKKLNDNPQQITVWKGRAENGFAYLLHHTDSSRNSHQYDPSEVTANFKYVAMMAKAERQVEQAKGKDIKFMLDTLLIGAISKREVLEQLSGHEFAKYHRQIEDVHAQCLKRRAEEWRQKMIAEGRKLEFIWINGPAGVGKSRLARDYAEKRGQPYFVTGSNRDIFEGYNGEHTLIIDDFREETMPYRDLLRITDPFGPYSNLVRAPARYHDAILCCDLIILTSPYRSNDYYHKVFCYESKETQRIDSYQQLARRITLWLEVNEYCIHGYTYNGEDWFDPIEQKGRPNPYRKDKNTPVQPTAPTNANDLFNSIVAKPIDTNEDINDDDEQQ